MTLLLPSCRLLGPSCCNRFYIVRGYFPREACVADNFENNNDGYLGNIPSKVQNSCVLNFRYLPAAAIWASPDLAHISGIDIALLSIQ
jgi:hypothetical protein